MTRSEFSFAKAVALCISYEAISHGLDKSQDHDYQQISLIVNIHTHPFNGPLSGTTRVSQYQKGKTNLDFSEARDSEWQRHQLDHMQVCTLLQSDNHASTPPLNFLQAGCPSCRPTNSVKALKVVIVNIIVKIVSSGIVASF